MSGKLMGEVWGVKLPKAQRDVLLCMADHADDLGRGARPSLALLAWKTDYDERTIIRAIKALREQGILLLTKRAGHHRPNEYRIDLSGCERKDPFVPKGDDLLDKQAAWNEARREKNRGDILSPDILSPDTIVSPEPSLNNKKRAEVSDSPETPSFVGDPAWDELRNALIIVNPSDFEGFGELWAAGFDRRRHRYALDAMIKNTRTRSFRYYETVYLRYNPDFVKPVGGNARAGPGKAKPIDNNFEVKRGADGGFFG